MKAWDETAAPAGYFIGQDIIQGGGGCRGKLGVYQQPQIMTWAPPLPAPAGEQGYRIWNKIIVIPALCGDPVGRQAVLWLYFLP